MCLLVLDVRRNKNTIRNDCEQWGFNIFLHFSKTFLKVFLTYIRRRMERTEMKLLLVIFQYCYKCLRVVGFLIYFSTSPRHFEQYFKYTSEQDTEKKMKLLLVISQTQ